jgi:hypothetical protein
MQSLVTDGCLNYMTLYGLNDALNESRLGTGSGNLATTQTAALTPIETIPTIYATKSYVTDAMYREFYNEWPASLVGTITNGCMVIGAGQYIVFKFGTSLVKTDDTKKIRVDSRVTYGRAA